MGQTNDEHEASIEGLKFNSKYKLIKNYKEFHLFGVLGHIFSLERTSKDFLINNEIKYIFTVLCCFLKL